MMPILEQSPAHHHLHGHAHQSFYSPSQQQQQQHTPELSGKMQLTLILPNGVPTVLNVDANTPMMDLLVQAASLNKLNPSGYSLVVLDSNQHVIHFKANQTVGQIGSSTISLLPKEVTHPQPSTKNKVQPFEITVRLQVNLPDAQKILIRVDPTLPLHEIKELVCKQKKYSNAHEYTFRLPHKLDQPILLGLSLASYKTNELTLVHQKQIETNPQYRGNQIQSFDRLYRVRSESQPPKETIQEVPTEQPVLINTKPTNNRSSTIRPSHTTLHAYWNDPNFDTQSQLSNSSASNKKRRAPRPPGCISPERQTAQMVYIHQQQSPSPPRRMEHYQSQDSLLSEAARRKRKAPVARTTTPVEKHEEEQPLKVEVLAQGNDPLARPGLQPPPPPSLSPGCPESQPISLTIVNTNEDSSLTTDQPQKIDIKIDPVDSQRLINLLQSQSPTSAKLIITAHSPDITSEGSQPATSSPVHQIKEIVVEEEKSPAVSPIIRPEEQKMSPKENLQVAPCSSSSPTQLAQVKTPVPKPPRQLISKEKKSSSSINGLLRIVNDHKERADVYQERDKQQDEQIRDSKENISYFRVAKSRCGKFETDNQGFVHNAITIFDSSAQTNQKNGSKKKDSQSSDVPIHAEKQKSLPNSSVSQTSKGKQAYHLLKKYEKEENEGKHATNEDMHELPISNPQEIVPGSPIQLEVTERTTHITVTVESDRKEMITRVSPVPNVQPSPPAVAPKPFGKTITEYRTVRRVGQGGETISSVDPQTRLSTTSNSSAPHDALMESIRKFGGSQNLGKK